MHTPAGTASAALNCTSAGRSLCVAAPVMPNQTTTYTCATMYNALKRGGVTLWPNGQCRAGNQPPPGVPAVPGSGAMPMAMSCLTPADDTAYTTLALQIDSAVDTSPFQTYFKSVYNASGMKATWMKRAMACNVSGVSASRGGWDEVFSYSPVASPPPPDVVPALNSPPPPLPTPEPPGKTFSP